MTVRELINELAKQHPHAEVFFANQEFMYLEPVARVVPIAVGYRDSRTCYEHHSDEVHGTPMPAVELLGADENIS